MEVKDLEKKLNSQHQRCYEYSMTTFWTCIHDKADKWKIDFVFRDHLGSNEIISTLINKITFHKKVYHPIKLRYTALLTKYITFFLFNISIHLSRILKQWMMSLAIKHT